MMGGTVSRQAARGVTGVLVAVTLIGVSACGGDDDESTAAPRKAPAAGVQAPDGEPSKKSAGRTEQITWERALEIAGADDRQAPAGGGDGDQIAELLEDVQVSLSAGSGQGVCTELSTGGQMAMARSIGGRDFQSCKDVAHRVSRERRQTGATTDLSEVLSVDVRRKTATARVRYPDGSIRLIPFMKENPWAWKLTTIDLVDENVIENDSLGPGHDFSDPRGVGPKGAIEEVIFDVLGDFPRGLGNSVCHELTPSGRREVERSGIGRGDCEKRLPAMTRRALARGYQPRFAEVEAVRIDGSRATARIAEYGHRPRTVPFVKTGEGWKLPSVGYAGVELSRLR